MIRLCDKDKNLLAECKSVTSGVASIVLELKTFDDVPAISEHMDFIVMEDEEVKCGFSVHESCIQMGTEETDWFFICKKVTFHNQCT